MSLETLHNINDFLTENSGVTGILLESALGGCQLPVRSFFFKPYKNTADALSRTGAIVAAPVLLGALSFEFALISVFSVLNALVELVTMDTKAAQDNLIESAAAFILTGIVLLAAVTSPIINAIDLIGGGIATLNQANIEENFECEGFSPS